MHSSISYILFSTMSNYPELSFTAFTITKLQFFFNGQFWRISQASRRLTCLKPSLLERVQGRRGNSKEKWSSNSGFVIPAQCRWLSSRRGPCDQPPTPPHTHALTCSINPQWRCWESKYHHIRKLNLAHLCCFRQVVGRRINVICQLLLYCYFYWALIGSIVPRITGI